MNKPTLSKVVCILFVFCAATAITSPAQVLTTLHSFAGYPSDGSEPVAGVIQAGDGNFYGTTEKGGASQNCPFGCGTIFKITPSGTLTTLHSFRYSDGGYVVAGVIQAGDGNFYGTTVEGGVSPYGTVFKITPSGTLTTLYSFCSQSNCTDGANPSAGLVQAGDGNFYGTTASGGADNDGTVFKITPSGALTTLYSFCSQANCSDGAVPEAGLLQASDGNFYGTTSYGGATQNCDGCGTVFKITPSGTLTTLHSFGYSDGAYPYDGLVQSDTDGNFYGTTIGGGANGNCSNGCGTVFRITPNGSLTVLHSFDGSDGAYPYAGLVQARDGNFYGTTNEGGASGNCSGGCGTVFKITSNGTLTTLHNFKGGDGNSPNGLVQARDGNFYGTTFYGGANDDGTVFRLVMPRPCIVCPSVE